MLTSEQIAQILEAQPMYPKEPESVENKFIAGLLLLQSKSKVKHGSKYAAEHDIFFADSISDLEDLTEQDVLKLHSLGWFVNEEFDCFAKFV